MNGLAFYSLKFTLDMQVNSDAETIGAIVFELLNVFGVHVDENKQQLNLESKQQYTAELKTRIRSFVDMHKQAVPSVNRLQAHFGKLDDDEYFFVLPPGRSLTEEQLISMMSELSSLNGTPTDPAIMQSMNDTFLCRRDNYDMIVASPPHKVGEIERDKRVCRFCGKSMPDTTFKQKGHAISEGLGNKTIILNDECDDCNGKFGRGIEPSAIAFLDPYRVSFGVKGKNGVPKISAEGVFFGKAPDGTLVIATQRPITKADGTPAAIEIPTSNRLVPQDVYRAFCKYALSVLPDYDANVYSKTVEWIKRETTLHQLPKVHTAVTYNFFDMEPRLVLYKRKSDDTNLPYLVGELHFTCLVIVFIVPLANNETTDFTKQENWDSYWNCFKQYSLIPNWQFQNFSSEKTLKMKPIFKFEPRTADKK